MRHGKADDRLRSRGCGDGDGLTACASSSGVLGSGHAPEAGCGLEGDRGLVGGRAMGEDVIVVLRRQRWTGAGYREVDGWLPR